MVAFPYRRSGVLTPAPFQSRTHCPIISFRERSGVTGTPGGLLVVGENPLSLWERVRVRGVPVQPGQCYSAGENSRKCPGNQKFSLAKGGLSGISTPDRVSLPHLDRDGNPLAFVTRLYYPIRNAFRTDTILQLSWLSLLYYQPTKLNQAGSEFPFSPLNRHLHG